MRLFRVRGNFVCFFFLFCVLLVVAGGCSRPSTVQENSAFEKWRELAKQARGHTPSPPQRVDVESSLPGDVDLEPQNPLPSMTVSSLDMRGANIVAVLRALAQIAGQSIMLSPGVSGTVNLRVDELPWDQVFRGVCRTNGLSWAWEGDILRIMAIEDMERNLRLESIKNQEPLQTAAIKISYANAVDLRDDIEKLLSKAADGQVRGSVEVIEHTNSLLIQAPRKDVLRFADLIAQLDQPSVQVHIKAHIVEASSSTARELGVQWSGQTTRINPFGDGRTLYVLPGTQNGSEGTLNNGQLGFGGVPFGLNFPGAVPNGAGVGSQLGFLYGSLAGSFLEVQLRALEEDNLLNILSSPSLTTLDNQTAYTENGREVPFATLDEAGNTTIEFKDAVLRMEITPHVIDNNNLRMDIMVKKDELDFVGLELLGNPAIIKKTTETALICRSGETVVIAGLKRSSSAAGTAGVPYLKDVPALGYLFSSDSKGEDMEEVLIFITPVILPQWKPGEQQKSLEEIEAELKQETAQRPDQQ